MFGNRAVRATVILYVIFVGHDAMARVVERIAAVVDKEVILLSELRARMTPFNQKIEAIPDQAQRKQRAAQLRQQMLDQMVNEKLIAQEARRLKLEVSPADTERAIEQVMRSNKLTREELDQALRQEGKSIEAYKREILTPQLLRLKVINIQVRSRIAVTEDEIKALYQQNLRSLGVETKVKAQHIFLALGDNASDEMIAQRRAFARALMGRIKKGEKFASLASRYSDDSVTRAQGGDLGYFGRGTLPNSVEDAVFAMRDGEVRGPLRTSRGFHIIKVTDRKESSARPYEEVKEQLHRQLLAKKEEGAVKNWLAEVRKRSYIDVKL